MEILRRYSTPEDTLIVWERLLNYNIEQLQDADNLKAVDTGTSTNLPNHGMSVLSASTGLGAKTYTLNVPSAGILKRLYCSLANSSDTIQVYSGSTATFFGPADKLRITFNTAGQVVELIGLSTARWAILNLGSTMITTTLPTLST